MFGWVVFGKTGRPSNGNKKELQYRKNDKKTRRLRDGAVSWAKNSMPGQRWLAENATAICMDLVPPVHSMKSGAPLVAALISLDYAGFIRAASAPFFQRDGCVEQQDSSRRSVACAPTGLPARRKQ
jgi:hypothetical protein